MSQAASQAHAFYRDVAKHGRVWTVKDDGGYPAPMTSVGKRAQPFWSTLSRVQKIIKTVPDYSGFVPEEISWEEFRDEILPEIERDQMLVGVNWSGPRAVGYDLDAPWVRRCVESAMSRAGGERSDA